ncbi:MAG: DNA alkylation repair protein [Gammaproteobacteria bacterium]|nr:DNA alkylation repair protein [Gammaproteobacteria bacterium]
MSLPIPGITSINHIVSLTSISRLEKNVALLKAQRLLRELADPGIAQQSQRFFKTAKGQYGEGDIFLGIRVPVLRKQVSKFRSMSLDECLSILTSKYHEERLFALLMLVDMFKRGTALEQKQIYDAYLAHTGFVNNWDLVDSSAHLIVGEYLSERDRRPLQRLARSKSLWERRIAMIATFCFIRNGQFDDALEVAEILLKDEHDLIHKAVGWMLREIGNRDKRSEVEFLQKHYQTMPRTMLRYAIEKFPEAERYRYLDRKSDV